MNERLIRYMDEARPVPNTINLGKTAQNANPEEAPAYDLVTREMRMAGYSQEEIMQAKLEKDNTERGEL